MLLSAPINVHFVTNLFEFNTPRLLTLNNIKFVAYLSFLMDLHTINSQLFEVNQL